MGGGGAVAWRNWAAGVLAGVSAPASPINFTSLWNWSNKESGVDIMRWNNPLNTTMPGYGGINENSVGVKAYPSVVDGIAATVATLLNGLYPRIVANLRNQVPHRQWQNASAELVTWGTGTNWLTWQLPAPGIPLPPSKGEDVDNNQARKLAITLAAATVGFPLDDASIDKVWVVVAPDFSNLAGVVGNMAKDPRCQRPRVTGTLSLTGSGSIS